MCFYVYFALLYITLGCANCLCEGFNCLEKDSIVVETGLTEPTMSLDSGHISIILAICRPSATCLHDPEGSTPLTPDTNCLSPSPRAGGTRPWATNTVSPHPQSHFNNAFVCWHTVKCIFCLTVLLLRTKSLSHILISINRWRSTRPWTWLSPISRTTWCAVGASTMENEFTCSDATQVPCFPSHLFIYSLQCIPPVFFVSSQQPMLTAPRRRTCLTTNVRSPTTSCEWRNTQV